jgi:hypothetical protein
MNTGHADVFAPTRRDELPDIVDGAMEVDGRHLDAEDVDSLAHAVAATCFSIQR